MITLLIVPAPQRPPGSDDRWGINNAVPPGTGWMFSPPGTPDTGDPDIVDVCQGATCDVIWAWAEARTSYPDTLDEPGALNLQCDQRRAGLTIRLSRLPCP